MVTNDEPMRWSEIDTAQEAANAVADLNRQLVVLGKEVEKVFLALYESLSNRIWGQLRNNIISVFDAFRVESLADYTQAASLYGAELAGSLYQLQRSFLGLKNAVIVAVAPFMQLLVPVLQTVLYLLTNLVRALGQVISMILLGTAEVEDYAAAMDTAAVSGKTLQKSLAGFDQINRLGRSSGGLSGVVSGIAQLKPLSGSWSALAEKLDKLLEPLRKLDLTPAAQSLEKLRKALQPITKALFEGLEWAWYNLLVPLAQWAVEELLPVFLDMLTASLEGLGRIIEELKPFFSWLWEECLKPLAQWKGNQVIEYLKGIATELTSVSGWITLNQTPVENFIDTAKLLIQALGGMAQKTVLFSDASNGASAAIAAFLGYILQANSPFSNSVNVFGNVATAVGQMATAFDMVTDASNGAWSAMSHVWEDGWYNLKAKFTDPAYSGVKQSMNRTIDMLNSMLSASTTGINHLGRAMNALSFTVPNWVPLVGGKSFSFDIRTLYAPQIPYLAKGAVLPANKPFMAVVGDQKHGTNVEAPLAVIQEAVANVMEDYSAANLAGHQATVGVLQELLQAVLGITIGDDVLCAAVQRYERKMAVVKGGYL